MSEFICEISSQKNGTRGNETLMATFNRCFEVLPATTPAMLDQVHRLRYQVYCLENEFEGAEIYPDHRESDVYDSRSAHYLLKAKTTGTALGTVRIILPSNHSVSKSFPIQGICQHQLLSQQRLNQSRTAVEVSRFAISKKYKTEWISQNEELGEEHVTALAQLMPLGLIRGAVSMSIEHGASEWFAVMEPSLLRRFKRFGMYFRPIGPMVEYHGFRQPCHAYLYDLLDRVKSEKPDVWEMITDYGKYLEPEKDVNRLIS